MHVNQGTDAFKRKTRISTVKCWQGRADWNMSQFRQYEPNNVRGFIRQRQIVFTVGKQRWSETTERVARSMWDRGWSWGEGDPNLREC